MLKNSKSATSGSRALLLRTTAATLAVIGFTASFSPANAKDPDDAEVSVLRSEVSDLKAGLAAMQARLDAQQAAVQQVQARNASVQSQLEAVQAEDATQIKTIPLEIATAVTAAKPKTDALYYKGVKITLGGYLDAGAIYRSHDMGSDMGTTWNAIPYANSKPAQDSELRFSAKSSRVSVLVQGDPDASTQLAWYGELDFQAATQGANSNNQNAFSPRLRQMYGTVDWNATGWHLMAGQGWSLATMNALGTTPRSEVVPPMIDGAFVPGFVYARQPEFRVAKDFLDKKLWLAVSVENPQTIFSGSVPSTVTDSIVDGSGFFAGASGGSAPPAAGGGTAATPTTQTMSLNKLPDVVAKVAYELPIAGRNIHMEAFGIGRAFTDRIGNVDNTVYGGGVGGGIVIPLVPKRLDLQASGLTGNGIGRYGTAQLPDATLDPTGKIQPLRQTNLLVGAIFHATKMLDLYSFAGEERTSAKAYDVKGVVWGYGSPLINNTGCSVVGGACSAATKQIGQVMAGFWQKIYQGPYGRAQVGMEYSYTEKQAFAGIGGAPMGKENIVLTSFRYFPF